MPIAPEQAADAIITLITLVPLCLVIRALIRCARELRTLTDDSGKQVHASAAATLRTVAPGIAKRFS